MKQHTLNEKYVNGKISSINFRKAEKDSPLKKSFQCFTDIFKSLYKQNINFKFSLNENIIFYGYPDTWSICF